MINFVPVTSESPTPVKVKEDPFLPFTGKTLEEKRIWILKNLERIPHVNSFRFACIRSIKSVLESTHFCRLVESKEKIPAVFKNMEKADFHSDMALWKLFEGLKAFRKESV